MIKFLENKGGISIIGILFLALVLILTLSYFHINLKAIVESPEAQSNIDYVRGVGRSLWNDYLKKPVSSAWGFILETFKKYHDGKGINFDNLVPKLPTESNQNANP